MVYVDRISTIGHRWQTRSQHRRWVRFSKKFKTKYALPFHFLSDYNKEVAPKYGSASISWPKRMTFIIDKDGRIEKIYNKVNVNTHAEKILDDLLNKK